MILKRYKVTGSIVVLAASAPEAALSFANITTTAVDIDKIEELESKIIEGEVVHALAPANGDLR